MKEQGYMTVNKRREDQMDPCRLPVMQDDGQEQKEESIEAHIEERMEEHIKEAKAELDESDKEYEDVNENKNEKGDAREDMIEARKEDGDDTEIEEERSCSICKRPESVTGKMTEFPNHMLVCPDCMKKSVDMISNGPIDLSQLFQMPGVSVLGVPEGLEQLLQGKSPVKKSEKPKKKFKKPDMKDVPPPHKIKEKLDAFVIGQERAKKAMAVAVYNHYKRVTSTMADDIEIEKSNMLMIGPTGSGKTYLVKTLAKLLDVPLAITDATSLTEAGYIGDDVESVVSKLLAAADNDVDRAEQGIIFIDEIDKISKKKNTHQRDVSGEAVQQGLLKLLEGSEVEVPIGSASKNMMTPMTTVNTKNILFICGGAFPDLEDIIKERLTKKASMGFNAMLKDHFNEEKNLLSSVTVEDLRTFGMIPEFIGRLPVIFTLEGLGRDMLVKILKEPKNAILKQYQKLLALDEVSLEFCDDALEAIAERALEKDTGARALRAIIEEFMMDIMYEIPKDDNIGRVTITREYIEGTGAPLIEMRSQRVLHP